MNNLWSNTFPIVKVYHKDMNYISRSWNRQIVKKFLLEYDGLRIIECMLIIHYNDNILHDLTIELSNMYNCIVGCKFCASGNLKYDTVLLHSEDYISQINTCIQYCNINPYNFKRFNISFYGIGEPSIVYKEINDAVYLIKTKYTHSKFNIATFGYNRNCFNYWENNLPNLRTLQIPYYSSQKDILNMIVQNLPNDYEFINILKSALSYKNKYKKCVVKINYIVIKGVNDSKEDIQALMKLLRPYINEICVRISYLNYTRIGKTNNLFSASSHRINEIYNELHNNGFECYIFGSERNIEVGCGQLVQNCISINEVG